MSETILSSLNFKSLYTKWAQHIEDSALADGNLPPWAASPLEMAPFPSPTNAFPELVRQLCQHSGDVDLLSLFYDSIKSYLAYELSHRNSSGLIGLESGGNWVTPSINDKGIMGTAHLYCSITRFIQMATILGYSADVESYTSHVAAVNSSFHDAYHQPATEDYRSSSTGGFAQTNNLLPVAFKMTSPTRRQAVIDKVAAAVVSRDSHLGTGVAGIKWLLPLLTEHGYIDLAYSVATQTTYPSWGYWKSLGATSLWEEWAGSSRSQNHPFLGTVVDWFYQHLAGIKITTAGYKSIEIAPFVPADLASAQGPIQTPLGKVISSWTNSTVQFALTLSIPAESSALVSLPVSDGKLVYENGKNAVDSERVEFVDSSSGKSSYNVTSGTYNSVVK